jgi:transposase
MNRIQSVERRNGQMARLWHQYSEMRVVLYSSITSKRAKPSIALFERLNDEIKKKRPNLKKKKVLFHQDNAPVHNSIKTTAKLHELGYELLPHPPYSPGLAPQ